MRHHFTKPYTHMEHLALDSLTKEELTAYDFFDVEDYQYTAPNGKKTVIKEPKI